MVSDEVQAYATLFKMIRVIMLGGVVVLYSLLAGDSEDKGSMGSKLKIPPFILGFFALCILASFNLLPLAVIKLLKVFSSWFMLVAMAGIGMRIKLSELLKEGPKALLLGGALSIIQILTAIVLIKLIL